MTTDATPKRRLRTLLTLPFIALIVTPSLVIAISSLYTGLAAVDTLSERIITDVSSRVEQASVHQMEEAAITLRSTMPDPADALGGGATVFSEMSVLEKKLFELTTATRTTSYLYYGAENGAFLGVDRGRVGARAAATVRVRTGEELFRQIYSAQKPNDRSRLLEVETRTFDARTRPWYRNAKEENRLTWTPVYVSFASGSLVTTASQPVTNDGRLLGVLAADVELSELSAFMKTVSVSENGVALIVDSDGYVVASSAPGLPFRDTPKGQQRIRVNESASSIERDVATWLQTLPVTARASGDAPPKNRVSQIRSAKIQASLGGAIDVAIRPISRIDGVDWDIVVAIPRSDLTDPIVRSSAIMFVVIVAALAAALQLAMWIVRIVTSDVDQLVRAANGYAIESKEFTAPKTTLHETSELASAFVNMFGRLRESLLTIRRQNEDLGALNATLEERVESRTRQLESKNFELTAEIARREQLELDVRAAAEAAVKQADDKARFMAMLSHELRTPLQAVIGASEMIAQSSPARSTETGVLTAASKSILALVDGVLSYAKLEAGKVEPQRSTFDLRRVTDEARDVALASAAVKAKTIQIVVDECVPIRVITDAGVYRQILINLLANAMRHAPSAHIVVAVNSKPVNTAINADDAAIALHVSVTDNGAGIPVEHRHKLFQPFQQVGRGSADPSRGSGLGLSICALLARALGGEISLNAAHEGGTSIQFWILAVNDTHDIDTAQPSPTIIDERVPVSQTAALRVLLVDDHIVNLRLVSEMLRVLGHVVVQAQSGEAAVEAMCEALDASEQTKPSSPFDVVLMDLNLPGISGFDTVVALRALCLDRDVDAPAFVALTASTEASDQIRAAEVGMPQRVTKPATLASLRAALRHIQASSPNQTKRSDVERGTAAPDMLSLKTLSQLVDIEKKSGNPFVASLIAEYLSGLDAEVSAVLGELSRGDLAAAKRAAHALAGASLSVGAQTLAETLRAKDGIEDDSWGARIERTASDTRIALETWVKSTG
jgi:signal transduction histidine kinase/DNA-binding response OmpR family regulator